MTQASSDQQRYRPAVWQWVGLLAIGLALVSGMARAESGALARLRADYVQTPIYFEPNVGQSADPVKFLARGPGYALFLTADEAVLALHPIRSGNEPAAVIRTRLEGINRNPAPNLEGLEKLPGISNYLLSNDRAKWRTQVPHYQRVRYAEVYPGIDLVYYGNPQQLEHDFIVAPGADPAQIQLAISGADQVRVNAQGDLILTVPGGEVVQQAPRIYQVIDGQQQTVAGRYVLRNSESAAATTVTVAVADPLPEPLRVGFEIAHYDPKQPLVIDPVLAYSTFLGGIKEDYATSIAVDQFGYAYVTGATLSVNFPAKSGLDPTIAGVKATDAFVAKFDFRQSIADSLVYATYLGGSDDKDDIGYGIAVDNSGFAYVTGTTASADFPIELEEETAKGGKDAFMVTLDASGSGALSPFFYLGGKKDDEGRGIALRGGMIYITGYTSSTEADFPLKNPFQPALLGGTDAFVIQLDLSGALYYASYLGGDKDDKGAAIAVDDAGNIHLTGSTASANFPVTGSATAFDTTFGGSVDAFVAKINPNLDGRYSLLYSTYLGGSGADSGAGIAVDRNANAYVTGSTASTNFPIKSSVAQGKYAGNGDAFIAKFDPAQVGANSLVYSTYLGGNGVDSGASIAVIDNPSSVVRTYVTGATTSTNFAFTADAADKTLGGGGDAFVSQISDTGGKWLYGSYLGGNNGLDSGAAIAADANGIYITGATAASDFPTTANAFNRINGSSKDAFVVKLEDSSQIIASLESPQAGSFESGIGLIRGWVCSANTVEVQIDGGERQRVAYGTTRNDTVGACRDTDNGFGYTVNWNELGDGNHTLRAFANGVQFANVAFSVTTLGVNYLPGGSASYTLSNFPQTGRNATLQWSAPHQNFVMVGTSGNINRALSAAFVPQAATAAYLESPQAGSFESGIGLIRGWACNAEIVEVQIDGGERQRVAYGTTRNDTVGLCGDTDNGFGYTVNWNELGDGNHTVGAFADGQEFARVIFTVTTLGEGYLRGANGEYTLSNFPQPGRNVTVRWAESHQNFVIINATR